MKLSSELITRYPDLFPRQQSADEVEDALQEVKNFFLLDQEGQPRLRGREDEPHNEANRNVDDLGFTILHAGAALNRLSLAVGILGSGIEWAHVIYKDVPPDSMLACGLNDLGSLRSSAEVFLLKAQEEIHNLRKERGEFDWRPTVSPYDL